jgi:hypothetical protein
VDQREKGGGTMTDRRFCWCRATTFYCVPTVGGMAGSREDFLAARPITVQFHGSQKGNERPHQGRTFRQNP